jgi:hypothetical protein
VGSSCWVGPDWRRHTVHCTTTALTTLCVESSRRMADATPKIRLVQSLKLFWVSTASADATVATLQLPGAAERHVVKRQFASELTVLPGRDAFYESMTVLCWPFSGVPAL